MVSVGLNKLNAFSDKFWDNLWSFLSAHTDKKKLDTLTYLR